MDMQRTSVLSEHMFPDFEQHFQLFAAFVRTVDSQWTYPSHQHSRFTEITVGLDGECLIVMNGRTYVQRRGDLMVIPKSWVHCCSGMNGNPMTRLVLHFHIGFEPIEHKLQWIGGFHPAEENTAAEAAPILERIVTLIQGNRGEQPIYTAMKQLHMHHAVLELVSSLVQHESAEDVSRLAYTSKERDMAQAVLLSLERIAFDPEGSIGNIPGEIGLSAASIWRVFHKVYGMSPRSYLTKVKLQKASELLLLTDTSVEHIAHSIGYSDISTFSKQFKRWTGKAPLHYRELGETHVPSST